MSLRAPRAYYNEIDPYAAQWIRNLVASGHIMAGDVDTRSILDVRPSDLVGYTRCHFFAGVAVWDYALRLAGWPPERKVWTGSCPCQPFSAAGRRGGTSDERHLWPAFFHLIEQRRPATVLGEQVASKDGLDWLDLVHADLEGADYDVGATDLCAAGVGAPHIRQRLWFVADADRERRQQHARLRQDSGGWNEASYPKAAWCSEAGFVADDAGERRHGSEFAGAPGAAPARGAQTTGWRPAGLRQPSGCGATGLVAVPTEPGSQGRDASGQRSDSQRATAERGGETCVMGHADRDDAAQVGASHDVVGGERASLGGRAVQRSRAGAAGRDGSRPDPERVGGPGHGHNSGAVGYWSECDWIPCRDGKARPVEPGTFPLAHGAPARVGRLRAYGNAICAEAAATFIGAVLDVRPSPRRRASASPEPAPLPLFEDAPALALPPLHAAALACAAEVR